MSRVKNNKQKNEAEKKTCTKCQKLKKLNTDYYISYSPLHADQRLPICKQCIQELANPDDTESIKNLLRQIDRPFLGSIWVTSCEEAASKDAIIGKYLKNISMNQYKNYTWADSEFNDQTIQPSLNTNLSIDDKEGKQISDDLIIKWGEGYTPEEYRSFERKYQMLKNNYQEKTAMHTEALLTYIRYRVKEELATAKGLVKDAKDWGALAQQAATNAKINPSQLSKSDLSDGLDTFGQLVRTVEQAVDIIPILPKFKEKPQDKVDFTIWCYVNYIRDLKGLPMASYEEIYAFYEQRKREYEQSSGGDEDEFV